FSRRFFSPHPPTPTQIYTLSLHDALPISALYRTFRFGPVLDVSLPHVGHPPPESVSREEKFQTTGKMATALTAAIDAPVYRVFRDRKSTRLNSSHLVISYAVFCLKKKKNS